MNKFFRISEGAFSAIHIIVFVLRSSISAYSPPLRLLPTFLSIRKCLTTCAMPAEIPLSVEFRHRRQNDRIYLILPPESLNIPPFFENFLKNFSLPQIRSAPGRVFSRATGFPAQKKAARGPPLPYLLLIGQRDISAQRFPERLPPAFGTADVGYGQPLQPDGDGQTGAEQKFRLHEGLSFPARKRHRGGIPRAPRSSETETLRRSPGSSGMQSVFSSPFRRSKRNTSPPAARATTPRNSAVPSADRVKFQ